MVPGEAPPPITIEKEVVRWEKPEKIIQVEQVFVPTAAPPPVVIPPPPPIVIREPAPIVELEVIHPTPPPPPQPEPEQFYLEVEPPCEP